MKSFRLFFTILILLSGSVCFGQERLLLSALTTSKKLVLMKIEYANKKYTVIDSAVFSLPIQGGLTAMAPLPNGRVQVAWTLGPTSQGIKANSIIKIKSMVVDSDLNQIGPIKTLPPNLTAHYNFSILLPYIEQDPLSSKFSFDAANKVVLINRNLTTGSTFGPKDTVFSVPGTADQFDTNFIEDVYAGLRYDGSRYNFVCGNVDNPSPTVVVPFVGDVISSTMLPIPNSNDFNFILMKRTNNPEKISTENFQIDGDTCQPLKPPFKHLAPKNQNLGQQPFFGGIASSISEDLPNGGHVFLIQSSNDGTDVIGYHMNTITGKKDSPPTKVPRVITPEDRFIYALFGMAVPTT